MQRSLSVPTLPIHTLNQASSSLAAVVDIVGKVAVGVSVVQSSLGVQAGGTLVTVGVIMSVTDVVQVSALVQNSRGLVHVAAASKRRVGVVEVAVHLVVAGVVSVGQDVLSARVIDISAVGVGAASGRVVALVVDAAEDTLNGGTGVLRSVVEVLLNLGVGCLGGSVVGGAGHGGAVSVGVGLGLATRASAVVLEVGALSLHFLVSSTGEKTINIGAQLVRGKSGRANDLVGSVLGILQNTLRQDVEIATLGQVVGSGDIKSHVN